MSTSSSTPPPVTARTRSPMGIILLTVFITMIGFGIVIPVLPVYAKDTFHLTPSEMGWLVGIFSLVQLVASPVLGKVSDRVGRRPVLMLSLIGTAAGFFILGAAHAAWMLFLGRIIDGLSGGNIATAQACIADVTPPEKRTKAMGLIGATFGLGFIMGPALGGILGAYGHQVPFYFAAGLSLVNLVLVIVALPETLTAERRLHPTEPAPLGEVFAGGRGSFITLLLIATLVSTTGFAFIHVLFALFCGDHFGWNIRQTSYAFTYVGFLAVLVQGGLLRRLLNRNIEKELALSGSVILALSLFLLPRSTSVGGFLGVCALLALGNGLLVPTLSGMSSRHVHGRAQGRVLGLMASAGSLGRFLGPAIAVVPLPLGFSEMTRTPEALTAVNQGYVTAFTWAAGFVLLAGVCLLFLRVPHDVPEEGVVVPSV